MKNGLDAQGTAIRLPTGVRNCLFSVTSRPALGPNRLPIRWMPEALSLGVKRIRAWSWLLTSIQFRVYVCVELYLFLSHTPPWPDAYLSTGENLPFTLQQSLNSINGHDCRWGVQICKERPFIHHFNIYTYIYFSVLLIFWTLPIVPYAKKHNVSETWFVSVLMLMGRMHPGCWVRYKELT